MALRNLRIEKAFEHIKGDGTYLGKSMSSTDPEAVINDKFSDITGDQWVHDEFI